MVDRMEDDEKERYPKYRSDKDPEAMAEYQAILANKKQNSGEARSDKEAGIANEAASVALIERTVNEAALKLQNGEVKSESISPREPLNKTGDIHITIG